jgi:glycine/D-amino acid oxidase-like deaminating enzyme
MTRDATEVVICGAGMAGISAAYHLAVKQGVRNILLVDERSPLTLTSDKSTECYRNWWPGPGDAMVSLMNRSIDIMEELAHESGNLFDLNRRGYLYATADPTRIVDLTNAAEEAARLGAGPLRTHPGPFEYIPAPVEGFDGQPTGSDLIVNKGVIREQFPYLTERTVAVLHARRCGWLSAQQLGMYLLEQARAHGVRFRQARVQGVDLKGGRVHAVHLEDGATIPTGTLVLAAGPYSKQVAGMMGVDLPIFCELHAKVVFKDDAGLLPRTAPLLIWIDPVELAWSEEERALFAESEETRWLLAPQPPGVHGRSFGGAGSHFFLMQWTLDIEPVEPVEVPRFDPTYPEVVVRGLAAMIPALEKYFGRLPRPIVDGGYYTKTRENRPLIGPLPVAGAFMIGALSGFGVMSSCAAGDLLAKHVIGGELPPYAPAFRLDRYQDPAYQELLENWGSSGQI